MSEDRIDGPDAQQVKYTLIPGPRAATENRIVPPMQYESSFRELFDWMLDHLKVLKAKEDGDLIIPATFVTEDYIPARIQLKDGRTRLHKDKDGNTYVGRYAENIDTLYLLPVDIDGGLRIEEAQARWSDYRYIIYSSFNHLRDGQTHKFRMLFEYDTPIKNLDYEARRTALLEWLGGKEVVDPTGLYRARGFYLPCVSKSNPRHCVLDFHEGKKLDVHQFQPMEHEPYVPVETPMNDHEKDEVRSKLKASTVDSYERWWQMVQAMKSEGYSEVDVLYVSAGNPLHTSPTTGIKDERLCRDTYRNAQAQQGGMGKLIKIIRATDPDFRISRAAKRQRRIEKNQYLINLINQTLGDN